MGYKEDLQKVHLKIDGLAQLVKDGPIPGGAKRSLENPVLLVALSILGSGLCAYLVAHWQVSQARDDIALDQRIDSRIEAKLQPVAENITRLREDLAYLKAKVQDATTKKIVGLSKLPQNEISANLPEIVQTIDKARSSDVISPPDAVAQLRAKIAQVPRLDPHFWAALSSVVSYQTLVAERTSLVPNIEVIMQTGCNAIAGQSGAPIGITMRNGFISHCNQQLDVGVAWQHVTFENAVIVYRGGPLSLDDVTFKNCLFLVDFPAQPKPPVLKLAEALVATKGPLSSFSLSKS